MLQRGWRNSLPDRLAGVMNEFRDRGVDDIPMAAVDGLIMTHPPIRPSAINVTFPMGEVATPRNLFTEILRLIPELRPPLVTSTA